MIISPRSTLPFSESPAGLLKKAQRVLRPRPGGQENFLRCADNELVAVSPWGEGKTWALCFKALLWTQMYPGSTNALLRKKGTWCRETVLPEFILLVGPAMFYAGWNEQKHKWTNPRTGATIVFVGLDEPAAWAGRKLGFVGVDDAIPPLGGTKGEGVDLDEWMAIGVGRMRDIMSRVRQIAMTTNPGPSNHWVLDRHREGKLRIVNLEPGSNVDPETGVCPIPADYLKRRSELAGVYRARYFHGLWVSAEGLVYSPPFSRNVHGRAPAFLGHFKPARGQHIELWIDWGYDHPACVLFVWRFLTKYVIFDEIYVREMTAKTLGQHASKKYTGCPISRIVSDHSGEHIDSFISSSSRFSRSVWQLAEKEVGVGVQTVLEYLAVDGNGEPSIFLDCDACPNTAIEFETLPWDTKRDRPKKDSTVKDHAADCVRYGTHTARYGPADGELGAVTHPKLGGYGRRFEGLL